MIFILKQTISNVRHFWSGIYRMIFCPVLKFAKTRSGMHCIFICISIILFSASHAESQTFPAWEYSLSGQLVCKAQETSFGFVCLADDRFLYAFTETGTLLWKSSVMGKGESLSVTQDDFIYTVSVSGSLRSITLYNSSGVQLWRIRHNEPILFPITIGRDGRIFVLSPENLTSYTIHGTQLWKLPLASAPHLPIYTANDGSLIVFQKETEALRISPYGEVSERITFIEKLTALESSPYGIVCAFESGIIQCYAIQNGLKKTLWSANTNKHTIISLTYGNNQIIAISNDGFICSYNIQTGQTNWGFFDFALQNKSTIHLYYTNDMFFAHTASYTAGYSVYGDIQWQKNIAEDSIYTAYTKSGYLITGTSDWILHAYRVHNPLQQLSEKTVRRYDAFGSQEETYTANLLQIIQDTTLSHSLIERNNALQLLAQIASIAYQGAICDIMKRTSEKTVAETAIASLGILAFDPEGSALTAIHEHIKKTSSKEISTFISACDAVYSICRFMGKPVILSKGREILLQLMLSQYGSVVNDYAAKTFEKLAQLF